MASTHKTINNLLSNKKPGALLFPSDFRDKGTSAAVKQALSRLVKDGSIKRLAHGIYYVPRKDPILGELRPSADEVVKMIAKKEKIIVRPAGVNALLRLGLTTQVPTRMVFVTDGNPRIITLGRLKIKFKTTTRKKLSTIGKISSLVIQALEELGIDEIDPVTENKIASALLQETPKHLQHDLKLAPASISDYIIKLLRKRANDQMVTTVSRTEKNIDRSGRTNKRNKGQSD